jgi:hypothetical protein
MASILIRTTYSNPQPYGDRTGQFYGTNYDVTNWVFDTVALTVSVQSGGVVNDDFDTGGYQDYSYPGEFYGRCVGTTREAYIHDGQGDFTVSEELNSARCSVLYLDSVSTTNETAAGADDGTATIQASGGIAPLTASVVELSRSQPATSGQPSLFDKLPTSSFTLRVTDSSSPAQVVQREVTILPYSAPTSGCQDEYADNYDTTATSGGAASCTYAPRWRSAWGPAGVAVRVPALPGQTAAYVVAELRIGFRPGHPLDATRPLGEPVKLRATVGPDGYATFRLAPYLWPALGSDDGAGGYRLDLNSPTATTTDLFTGYELRRTTGELLEHGYALNAAVPDAQLLTGPDNPLSPFAGSLPVWPGLEYDVAYLSQREMGRFGAIDAGPVLDLDYLLQPCPAHPVPVMWLAPGGGYGYWIFGGRPQIGDQVGESQGFTEPATGERRWSQRGETRGTITASSGVFNGAVFGEGLRTLWASPQVWYQPQPGGEWVAVTLEGGSYPVRRLGLPRTEFSLSFTVSTPQYAQGQ